MAKIPVQHEIYGYVLLDTETQTYEYYENDYTIMFEYNNKKIPFFESALEFLSTSINMCVVPMICVKAEARKRRTLVELIDFNNYAYTFFNVEIIDSRWVANKVDKFIKSRCYFVLLQKDIKAMNDCRVLSCMEIKKGEYGKHTPLKNESLQAEK